MNRSAYTSEEVSPAAQAAHRVLAAVSEMVARQRAAILRGDVAAVTRLSEALAERLADLAAVSAAADGGDLDGKAAAELASRARQLREEIALNRALLANGLAVTDHFARCIADAAPSTDAALFSGVA